MHHSTATTTAPAATPTADKAAKILQANLDALRARSPRAAEQIAAASPLAPERAAFWTADDNAITGTLDGRSLASKRRPLEEAARLAERANTQEKGAVAVLGFGLGHHVQAIARCAGSESVLLVFEPDVALLRAVLERVDHSCWIQKSLLVLVTETQSTRAAIQGSLSGAEAFLAVGVQILEHPPSHARLGDNAARFGTALTESIAAVRTMLTTTLLYAQTTLRNGLMNLGHYIKPGAGVAHLKDAHKGRPAVVVAAGPSLRRNIHLLGQDGVRDRCLIVAVQTTLKPLLEAGIRPHFVTALDHHQISARFYEGLTEEDLRGVTLIAEPKVNPAVPDAFQGNVLCPADRNLDLLLGRKLAGDHGSLGQGSTVAHLAHMFARYLGADPVILVGQDLGFTDGQYYADGASIHNVWAPELNPFRTLEMFEWERIARSRSILRRAKDHLGRPVYTDEQMHAYLTQFESLFLSDTQAGLTTIDATEGGIAKAHTTTMPLAEALAAHCPPDTPRIQERAHSPHAPADHAVRAKLKQVQRDATALAILSRKAGATIRKAQQTSDEETRRRIISDLHRDAAKAVSMQPAFDLAQRINPAGVFHRLRTDRALRVGDSDATTVQDKQLDRDAENVRRMGEASDELSSMLGNALRVLNGAAKETRPIGETPAAKAPNNTSSKAGSCIAAIAYESGSGNPHALRQVLERLAASESVHAVALLTSNPEGAFCDLGPAPPGISLTATRTDGPASLQRRAAVRTARAWSRTSWRGSIGNTCVYDEVFAPTATAATLREHGADAAMLLGADWTALKPDLCRGTLDRWRESNGKHDIVFSQAAPGLAPAIVSRTAAEGFAAAEASPQPAPFLTIGGVLGYLPAQPKPDPIVQPICLPIDPAVRDADSLPIAGFSAPAALTLEPTGPHGPLDTMVALRAIDWFASTNPGAPCTIGTAHQDALEHPQCASLISHAKHAGIGAVHVRTALRADWSRVEKTVAAGTDIVSVDMYANTPETYLKLTGQGVFKDVRSRLLRLLDSRTSHGGLPWPWVVPRITRRDEVYEEIEPFYNTWLMRAGAAVLDPLASFLEGNRIAPLTPPPLAAQRIARLSLTLHADGAVRCDPHPHASAWMDSLRNHLQSPAR